MSVKIEQNRNLAATAKKIIFTHVLSIDLRWPATVTSNTNYSRQIQNPDIKYKLCTYQCNAGGGGGEAGHRVEI